jgi:hypothetical protein
MVPSSFQRRHLAGTKMLETGHEGEILCGHIRDLDGGHSDSLDGVDL